MKQRMKISTILLVIALVITAICNHGVVAGAAKKATKVGNGMYTVISEKNKTARFDKISSKTKTTLVIPATVKIGKKTYKVTAVKANALKSNKKVKKLTIGKNVKTIGKNAFCCKNLKNITIKTTKLTMKSVGKNAFKGLNSKVSITVPDSKLATYQKLLKARGLKGKNQVVKSDREQSTETKKPTTLPDPEVALRVNPLQDKGFYWPDTTTETDSEAEKRVELAIRTDIPLDFYGYWKEVKNVKSDYKSTCTACQLTVTSKEDRIIHGLQSGHTGYVIRTKGNSAFDASVWHPDSTPCSIVYHMTLPEGLEIVEDSVSVAQLSRRDTLLDAVGSEHYKVSIEGRNLTISIDNIKTDGKANGFCVPSGKLSYLPIAASFSVKVTDSASAVNTIAASVSYSQGTTNKAITTNTVTINKK